MSRKRSNPLVLGWLGLALAGGAAASAAPGSAPAPGRDEIILPPGDRPVIVEPEPVRSRPMPIVDGYPYGEGPYWQMPPFGVTPIYDIRPGKPAGPGDPWTPTAAVPGTPTNVGDIVMPEPAPRPTYERYWSTGMWDYQGDRWIAIERTEQAIMLRSDEAGLPVFFSLAAVRRFPQISAAQISTGWYSLIGTGIPTTAAVR